MANLDQKFVLVLALEQKHLLHEVHGERGLHGLNLKTYVYIYLYIIFHTLYRKTIKQFKKTPSLAAGHFPDPNPIAPRAELADWQSGHE